MKGLLLITPPFTQLNTPYPATAYLKGFLNTKSIESFQIDLGIETIVELFTRKQFEKLFALVEAQQTAKNYNVQRILALKNDYLKIIEPVIAFLQGKSPNMARSICSANFLPRASRFEQIEELEWAFGTAGLQDKAKHLATLFLEDLSDFIIECIDENFGFSRYAERLGMSANSFDELHERLCQPSSFIDDIALEILKNRMEEIQPKMVGFSVPFPGNLYSAFRCAQFIQQNYPDVAVVMGGGFANTELRSVSDPRVFDYFDFITLDDGELPLELLWKLVSENYSKPSAESLLKRTFYGVDGKVIYNNNNSIPDYKQKELGTPDYSDLLLDQYISVIEIANPMHSLWTDGRWNKLTMAHGCYWAKCTFCDGSLDYIQRYDPSKASLLVDRMEVIIAQTGERGFHFVDEAAPPALMKALALEIIKRQLSVTWWTNIRFESSYTQDLCQLLKASGCIAVSGGLEVASDRLLKLINKGVTVEQVAQVTRNLTDAGIMVHAYLMYAFPTQTEQETIDSLEMVRQLFEQGIVQSGFWHQFALTTHSPVGRNPETYGIIPQYADITFANNDVQFVDKTGIDHQAFSYGLKKALYNYMHDLAFEIPLDEWFDFETSKTTVRPDYIENSLKIKTPINPKAHCHYLGYRPLIFSYSKNKKGKSQERLKMQFHSKSESFVVHFEKERGLWFISILEAVAEGQVLSFAEFKEQYSDRFSDFDLFWNSETIKQIRAHGFLFL